MATISRFSGKRSIPSATTRKSSPTTTNFAKGIKTYKPNDTMGLDEVYLAQNARFDRIGEYATRHGLKALNEPIGTISTLPDYLSEPYEMVDFPTNNMNYTLTPMQGTDGNVVYSITLRLQPKDDSYGVVGVGIWDNVNKKLLASSYADPDAFSPDQETDYEFKFNTPIEINATTVANCYYVLLSQGTSTKEWTIAKTTELPIQTVCYVIKHCTPGDIGNIFEANIDGVRSVLFTFRSASGCKLYSLAQDGTNKLIRTLDADVENVRFNQNVNEVRYVDGKNGPHKLTYNALADTWTDTAITTTDLKTGVDLQIKLSNILDDTQDNLIYFDAETDTQAVWGYPYGFAYAPEADWVTTGSCPEYDPDLKDTPQPTATLAVNTFKPTPDAEHVVEENQLVVDANGNYAKIISYTAGAANCTVQADLHSAPPINTYDSFDRDFRQNFPAILTGDPLTAMFNLGGVVYMLTRKNKYYKYSQTADVWSQAASNAQNGTFSQESVVCDLNYAYFANDSGVYIFDGSSEASLTESSIQNVYDAIPNKEQIKVDLYNNRLYVFYPSTADGPNDHCLVYNINLKLWESFDNGTYVNATNARRNTSNRFICGHSKMGLLMLAEDETSPYSDLGAAIEFDLETAYQPFGTPSQLKRIVNWRPEFSSTDNPIYVACGYALDFSETVKYAFSINLKDKSIVNTNYTWDNPSNYGVEVTPTILTTKPQVYGDFRRCQIRYQHHAAFEPINFKSHTLDLQIQRIR